MNPTEIAQSVATSLFPKTHNEILRFAVVELILPALEKVRTAALREALAAVEEERLEEDADNPEDAAYEVAIEHCELAIQRLLGGELGPEFPVD